MLESEQNSSSVDPSGCLAGTVKLYHRHLIVCTGRAEWPARIEVGGGYLQAFAEAMRSVVNEDDIKLKLTASDEPSYPVTDNPRTGYDIFLYPDELRLIDVRPGLLPSLVESLLMLKEIPESIEQEPILDKAILVCCHGARDARCGQCGPPLAERFVTELSARKIKQGINVQRVSHVGGHAYAGNVLLYPGGHWYGSVRTSDVAQIISEHVLNGRIIPHLWRGQMGMSPDEQFLIANQWLAD